MNELGERQKKEEVPKMPKKVISYTSSINKSTLGAKKSAPGTNKSVPSANKTKKEPSKILKWLKKIFSLQFLGIVLTIIFGWYGVASYLQNQPGELIFKSHLTEFDKNFNCIFYGFELEKDTISIMDLPNIPIFANITSHTIEDITAYSYVPKIYSVAVADDYWQIESEKTLNEKEYGIGFIHFLFTRDKIKPLDGIRWPIIQIAGNKNQILIYPIDIFYSYKTKEMSSIRLMLVGIPNNNHEKTKKDIERLFIKTIRPYLMTIDNIDKCAIIFGEKVVESLSKEKVSNSDFYCTNILDLQN